MPSPAALMAGMPTHSQAAAAAVNSKHATPEELQAWRDSALAKAKKAEDEAAAAEWEAAADRAQAAQVRNEAHLGDLDVDALKDDAPDADAASDRVIPDHDLRQTMLMHEAATVVNLHHHAASIRNIRNLVHVILDLTDNKYKR